MEGRRGTGVTKWSGYWDEHCRGARVCLVAEADGNVVGYGSLVWRSQNPPFAAAAVPEIQDMVVAHRWRGRGVATALVVACEARALTEGISKLGIGFALYADYGAAQRLYVRLGFVPDGRGVSWRNKPVKPGDNVRVDDDLVLWLCKSLKA